MTNPLSPMTKLDAVNGMLASIGQAPVNSLAVAGIRDVAIANLALETQLRSVLNRGWSFNTDTDYELVPDGSGHVLVPATALWLDPTNRSYDFVQRFNGGAMKLYDRAKRTFVIEQNPVHVNVIWAFEFEEIPQPARDYIATRAARIFQSQVIGSDILFRYTELHENEALASLQRLESRSKTRNMLTRNDAIFDRRYNPRRY